MDLLRPVIQPYAWGSRTAIAELQGRPVPAPGPEAELWMGAHPSAPCQLNRAGVGQTTLEAVIESDPVRELGPRYAARFGGRLPFLLKVLSAEKALSIQVHPSRDQARQGYAAEIARGLAPDDPARNYVDDWPKPELLYALTPFEVAGGLRDPDDAAALLRALALAELRPLESLLPDLGAALAAVLEWPSPGRLLEPVLAACARLAGSGGRYAGACAAAIRVAGEHPGDLGAVALLLMRHVVLAPGQAMFMSAGGLHAYLHGTGIELLANSDNVVRAGLTGKHVDVPELLRLVDASVSVPLLPPRPLPGGITWFDSPAPEFRLHVLDLDGAAVPLPAAGPRILLCLDGACDLRSASAALTLKRGDSCFISFADGPVHASGHAQLILASPGEAPAS